MIYLTFNDLVPFYTINYQLSTKSRVRERVLIDGVASFDTGCSAGEGHFGILERRNIELDGAVGTRRLGVQIFENQLFITAQFPLSCERVAVELGVGHRAGTVEYQLEIGIPRFRVTGSADGEYHGAPLPHGGGGPGFGNALRERGGIFLTGHGE